MTQFNVLSWDTNGRCPISYDVLPYFRDCYKRCKKKDRPDTKEEWTIFVKDKGMYRFWGQCQYEFIASEWPPSINTISAKVDVWQQIEANIDLIVRLLMEEYHNDSK